MWEVKGEYEGIRGEEEEESADYGGMVQPSQQHVAPCVKVVECGLARRGLRISVLDRHPGRGYTRRRHSLTP